MIEKATMQSLIERDAKVDEVLNILKGLKYNEFESVIRALEYKVKHTIKIQ